MYNHRVLRPRRSYLAGHGQLLPPPGTFSLEEVAGRHPQGGGGGGGGGSSRPRGERGMEKEVTTKAQQPPTGPALPSNYVTLAQLQEQRRRKVEGQRKEEGDQAPAAVAAAEARLRKHLEEEEELLLLRELKEEEKRGEREEAPRPGGGGAALVRPGRGGRSSRTQWRPKNGGAPVGGVAGATGRDIRKRGGRGRANGRGEEGELRDRRRRSSNRTGSGCTESGTAAARSEAAVAAVGKVDPKDRSESEGKEDVMPRPIDAEEGGNLQQTERGGGASEMEVEQREGNVDLASSCRGQEGTKVTQRHFLPRVTEVGWRARHSEKLQPANGIVSVACKLKDMSITMAGEDKVATGGSDGGDRWHRRSTVGRRGGGYPGFRGNRALGPWHRWRPAEDKTMWVRKMDSS